MICNYDIIYVIITWLLYIKFIFSIGSNVKLLLDRPDGVYCFREKKGRVYYVSEKILSLTSMVNPERLTSIGTCFGKFTKSEKFRLHITALYHLAPYAQVIILFLIIYIWIYIYYFIILLIYLYIFIF